MPLGGAFWTGFTGTAFVLAGLGIAAQAEGLDKVNAALEEAIKSNALGGVAFESLVDLSAHHDELDRTSATYR